MSRRYHQPDSKLFLKTCLLVVAATCLLVVTIALPQTALAEEQTIQTTPPAILASLRERIAERRRRQQAEAGSKQREASFTGPGDHVFSITHNGLNRQYRVHVPKAYSPSNPTPLVFSFHGGGGNMDYQANDEYYGQVSKSEQANYIAVFPNGYSKLKSGKLATWNAGNCCASARDDNSDDVGFVRQIIERLTSQLNIDRAKIFANGIFNGGMMSYRLACEMSDVFRAVASVAGTDNTASCAPKKPISILHIHARDDELELFDGGSGRQSSKVTSFVSVPNSIAKWVELNHCQASPERIFANEGAYCDVYRPCRDGTEIELCVTETGGHSWPGGKKPRGNTPTSNALSATDLIWDFFSRQ